MNNYRQIPISQNYIASSDGFIKRISSEHPLKGQSNKYRNNYVSVCLSENGEIKRYFVHKLVALTFPEICGNWFEGAEIDHINGITTDNRAENLRWVDRKGNMNNPITIEKIKNNYTDEHREICRKRMIENNPVKQEGYWTEERRKAVSERCLGRKHKTESIEKMKQVAKGRYLGGKSPRAKKVKCITPNGEETIYDAFRSAARELGINHSIICTSIKNNKPDKDGNLWELC